MVAGRSSYFGADYYINEQNSITAAYFRVEIKDTDETFLNYNLTNDVQIENTILRTGNSIENRNYNQLETNYTVRSVRRGKKLLLIFNTIFGIVTRTGIC